MKKIGLFTVAILLAALATGCSKSESDGDSNIKEKMENQQLINSISQHIVGTWVHDGDCKGVYDLKTPANEIILKDDLKFEESEHDTFTFAADGTTLLVRTVGDGWRFDGKWRIKSGVINADGDDLLPPYGIIVIYGIVNGFAGERSIFNRILFSDGFKQMFLYDERSRILRYNLKQ